MTSKNFQIINTERADLPFIYGMFEAAMVYQKKKGFPVWKGYDKKALDEDIAKKRQYKILINGNIACIFTTCFSDKIVWKQHDVGDAIYLHRIVVNPKFKGQRLVGLIMDWTSDLCKKMNRDKIRIDTWADNPTIIKYYESFGFEIIEYSFNPDVPELPIQMRGNDVVLMEFKV